MVRILHADGYHRLKGLSFADLKCKMTDADKERLKALNVVSEDDKAYWQTTFFHWERNRNKCTVY